MRQGVWARVLLGLRLLAGCSLEAIGHLEQRDCQVGLPGELTECLKTNPQQVHPAKCEMRTPEAYPRPVDVPGPPRRTYEVLECEYTSYRGCPSPLSPR